MHTNALIWTDHVHVLPRILYGVGTLNLTIAIDIFLAFDETMNKEEFSTHITAQNWREIFIFFFF